ncbi:MAG: N(4)-(beta-N-acetylglucosaminyl)-L-asparaginase [Leeuwenhoekiella sp.]
MNDIRPVSICTWQFENANIKSGEMLEEGRDALDAVIAGASVEEQNIKNTTVGLGGDTDREGSVSLDACVMDHDGNCGAVLCVTNTSHVSALARKVMEETPHVMLAGAGAENFALKMGFAQENLLIPPVLDAYQNWLKSPEYRPIINIENHDTIGILGLDQDGKMAGACSTSGLSYKMKGRVGDSPIIGSGLYIDGEVGGAAATGMGEEILKICGSFLIVELMRNGMSPQQACKEAVQRIIKKNKNHKDFQVAFIAMDFEGNTGSYCIHKGFKMMHYQNGKNTIIDTQSFIN